LSTDPFALVRERRQELADAKTRLREAIVAAYESRGERPVNRLAEVAGLTRARIYQLVNEAKEGGTHGG
jgi:hypothetical protein